MTSPITIAHQSSLRVVSVSRPSMRSAAMPAAQRDECRCTTSGIHGHDDSGAASRIDGSCGSAWDVTGGSLSCRAVGDLGASRGLRPMWSGRPAGGSGGNGVGVGCVES